MSVFSRLSAPLQSSQAAGSPSLPVFSNTARAKLVAWLWVFPWPLHGIPVGKLWSQWGHLQHESPGQTRWSLGNMLFCTLSLAKYGTSALWKDSKISPETQDLGKSSFLQERMMILQVHLDASVPALSPVNTCTVSPGLCPYTAEYSTHRSQGKDSFWQWQPNRSQCKSTFMNTMPSCPNKWSSSVLNLNPTLFQLFEKK